MVALTKEVGLQVQPLYLSLFLMSVFVPALATVVKEGIFRDANKKLGRWAAADISAELGPCISISETSP